MQTALVLLAVVASAAYLVRGLAKSLSGECVGCGGAKKPAGEKLIPVSELTARLRGAAPR